MQQCSHLTTTTAFLPMSYRHNLGFQPKHGWTKMWCCVRAAFWWKNSFFLWLVRVLWLNMIGLALKKYYNTVILLVFMHWFGGQFVKIILVSIKIGTCLFGASLAADLWCTSSNQSRPRGSGEVEGFPSLPLGFVGVEVASLTILPFHWLVVCACLCWFPGGVSSLLNK